MKLTGKQLRIAIITHDLIWVALAWLLGYLIRYEFDLSEADTWSFIKSVPIVIVIQGIIMRRLGLYRGMWRFASIPDLWNIIRASVIGVLAIGLTLFLFNRLEGIPRTSLLLYPVFLMFFLGGPRLVYRMWKDHSLQVLNSATKKRTLILGAGSAGDALIRDMKRTGEYFPVGLLDDDPGLKGNKIQGVLVYGTIQKLERYVDKLTPDLIIIAMPSASNRQMQEVVAACEKIGVPFRTLPRMNDLVSGKVTLKELRNVAIEDLLGREPVKLDWQSINRELTGKTILVTGGGGSIGSELCRQIAALGPNKLIILENSEYNLYRLDLELQKTHPEISVHACLGDVTDAATVEHVFNEYKPAVVFHAAAYKHVPLLENQTREAVSNNIIGTSVVARTADKYKIDTFVLISTDKAVNPTNTMGTSKRVAEIFCQNLNERSETRFITVRFGNVLGSAGSVVPLFKSQIEKGGPVTVTHPEIKRYFMTIPEACQLILQAGAMGKGGEIFVLDMGEPIKITYLAEQMIRLSGMAPGEDIEIIYTGLRPGEKLFEELFHENEELGKTDHDKILLAKYRQVDWQQLEKAIIDFGEACKTYDENGMKHLLDILVPEHKKSENDMENTVINFNKVNK